MAEVRTISEGELWWVQASGSGRTWATAATPASGLFGFVRSMQFTSAQRVITPMERGIPDHHKVVGKDVINLQVSFDWTGTIPNAGTGTGASVPMFHLEHLARQPEIGNTARYHQFHGCVVQQTQLSEGEPDSISMTMLALAVSGANTTGYLKV